MAFKARTVTPANGSQTAFPVSFPLPPVQGRAGVQVFVHSTTDPLPDNLKVSGTDYNWVSDGQISMVVAPAAGMEVDIRRATLDTALDNTVQAGGSLRAQDLVQNDTQLLYLIQEREDEDTDLQTQLTAEVVARQGADTTEAAARAAGDTTEANARIAGDALLQSHIDAIHPVLNVNVNGAPNPDFPFPVFTPELFAPNKPSGVVGDGTDDSPALNAASVAAAAGGGSLFLYPGRTYWVGASDPANTQGYRFGPDFPYPIDINAAAKPVRIFGNGATIKCIAGLKFGSFNVDGTVFNPTMPYTGPALSSPYFGMIRVANCSAPVGIQDLMLDGNLGNLAIGGQWGDTGRQLPAIGLLLSNNTGGFQAHNVHTHHHGLDGIEIDGVGASDAGVSARSYMNGIYSYCNGRQAMSIVGGKGFTFDNSSFSWTGRLNPVNDAFGAVVSNPGAGVDFEAEGGKVVRDMLFRNCELIGNYGSNAINDGTNCDRIRFEGCSFIGTTNYALWPRGPGFEFDRCRMVGTVVFAYGPAASVGKFDAANFKRCLFSNSASLSPTGEVFTANNLLLESPDDMATFDKCKFVHDINATAAFNGSTDQLRLNDCEFWVLQGSAGFFGRFSGETLFVEVAPATHRAVPSGGTAPFGGIGKSGEALDYWYFKGALNGFVKTLYPGTISRQTGA